MDNILIKKVAILDSFSNFKNERRDILIKDGMITEIDTNISAPRNFKVIDGRRKFVCGGLIDMHVHLRDPGYTYKEDIVSGTKAAIAGGFTSVVCMPNTSPVIDNGEVVKYVKKKAKEEGHCKVYVVGAISKGLEGKELSDIESMVLERGIVALSDDGKPVMNDNLMLKAMERAKYYDIPIISHCEDLMLPVKQEENMILRDIIIAKKTKCRLHIAHVSTKDSVELIRQAKEEGINITAEVTPHHLSLDCRDVMNTSFKMNPPLRTKDDCVALKYALLEGVIDVIASDHAPHSVEEKNRKYKDAPNGCIGLETTLPLVLSELRNERYDFSYSQIISKMTVNPAKILNLSYRGVSRYDVANLLLFDPYDIRTVNAKKFFSKAQNCPFHNKVLQGWPTEVICNGELKYVYNGVEGLIHGRDFMGDYILCSY